MPAPLVINPARSNDLRYFGHFYGPTGNASSARNRNATLLPSRVLGEDEFRNITRQAGRFP